MIYLPFADYQQCASCFDSYTLRKQCIEIIRLLSHFRHFGSVPNDADNPCLAGMWREHQGALVRYGKILAQESLNRGYNDTFLFHLAQYQIPYQHPQWLGWEPLHKSHRAALRFADEKRLVCTAIRSTLHRQPRRQRTVREVLRDASTPVSVESWLNYEFGAHLSQMDYSMMENLKHIFLERHISCRQNYYVTQQNFTENANLPLAWPYQYYEEPIDERVRRNNHRPSRARPRSGANPVRPSDCDNAWLEASRRTTRDL